jgi:hypothetical protein
MSQNHEPEKTTLNKVIKVLNYSVFNDFYRDEIIIDFKTVLGEETELSEQQIFFILEQAHLPPSKIFEILPKMFR